jgi:hypothetical protein
MLISGWTAGPAHIAHTTRVTEAFTYEQIMQEWEGLL